MSPSYILIRTFNAIKPLTFLEDDKLINNAKINFALEMPFQKILGVSCTAVRK